MKMIEGGVTAAQGFVAGGIHCGIRKNKSKPDLAMIYSEKPCAAAAAVSYTHLGQDAIAVKRYITPSETQPEVEATDGVLAKKIQNVYVYCQYITRVS